MSRSLRRWMMSVSLVATIVLASPVSSFAQTSATPYSNQPDPSANPVLSNIIKGGAKAYYMGTRSGIDGWLLLKDQQVQFAYDIPGNQDLLIGAIFGPSGESVTSAQVQSLMNTHAELKALLTSQGGQLAAQNGANTGQISGPALSQLEPHAAPMAPLPSVPLGQMSRGDVLMAELMTAPGQLVGAPTAPLLVMVMDPTCPHCQKTWKALRDKVFANELQVKLVPITRDPDDAEQIRTAAELLHSADPLTSWNKYVEGDKAQFAGLPDANLVQAVRTNHQLVDRWHITDTPFLVYRARDGKVKIIQGEPEHPASLAPDIAP